MAILKSCWLTSRMTKFRKTSSGCAGHNSAEHPESGLPSTPSQQAKSVGLKSLTQVSEMTGVSLQTLTNWAKNKPELFETVLAGCVARLGT